MGGNKQNSCFLSSLFLKVVPRWLPLLVCRNIFGDVMERRLRLPASQPTFFASSCGLTCPLAASCLSWSSFPLLPWGRLELCVCALPAWRIGELTPRPPPTPFCCEELWRAAPCPTPRRTACLKCCPQPALAPQSTFGWAFTPSVTFFQPPPSFPGVISPNKPPAQALTQTVL